MRRHFPPPPSLSLRLCHPLLRPLSTAPSEPSSLPWRRRRLQWLATGACALPAPPPGSPALDRFAATVDAARAARAAHAAASRPIRIREHSVLAALRDPSRLIVFNRPMPLPSLVPIMVQLWAEEAVGGGPTR